MSDFLKCCLVNSLIIILNAGFILAGSPFAIIHYFIGVICPVISFYNLGKLEGKND